MKYRPEFDEYTPNAAAQARARDRQRLAREREQAAAREVLSHQEAIAQARAQAEPIADEEELRAQVARLAAGLGLKKKGKRR